MTVRWKIQAEVTVLQLTRSTRVLNETPVVSEIVDVRTYPPGSRFLIILNAFETNVANTGGVWTVTESATSGGAYTAATLSNALTATPQDVGNNVQKTVVAPNPAKPFVKVTFTGADTNAEVDVTATLIVVPRGM